VGKRKSKREGPVAAVLCHVWRARSIRRLGRLHLPPAAGSGSPVQVPPFPLPNQGFSHYHVAHIQIQPTSQLPEHHETNAHHAPKAPNATVSLACPSVVADKLRSPDCAAQRQNPRRIPLARTNGPSSHQKSTHPARMPSSHGRPPQAAARLEHPPAWPPSHPFRLSTFTPARSVLLTSPRFASPQYFAPREPRGTGGRL